MDSSLPAPTAEQAYRIEIIKREIGCIACIQAGHHGTPADAHHLLDPKTGNRISHDATIPLCKPHHVGVVGTHSKKIWFSKEYGSDQLLLAETNFYYEQFRENTIGGQFV